MPIVVNTNVASLIAQNSLSKATTALDKSMQRMSTGLKINTAGDDAAGLFISISMNTQIKGSDQALANTQIGVNMMEKAEGDITVIQDNIDRIRVLANQAANGYYSSDSIKAIKAEVEQRVNEINRIANASEFNGIKLLNKDAKSTLRLQVGANASAAENSITVTGVFGNATAGTNGINLVGSLAGSDVKEKISNAFLTADSAALFMKNCDASLKNVATRRTLIGAAVARLNSAMDSLTVQSTNLNAAKATILDADIAKESSEYIRSQILQQTSSTLLASANQAPAIATSLV